MRRPIVILAVLGILYAGGELMGRWTRHRARQALRDLACVLGQPTSL